MCIFHTFTQNSLEKIPAYQQLYRFEFKNRTDIDARDELDKRIDQVVRDAARRPSGVDLNDEGK